jgi:hypothetical protein
MREKELGQSSKCLSWGFKNCHCRSNRCTQLKKNPMLLEGSWQQQNSPCLQLCHVHLRANPFKLSGCWTFGLVLDVFPSMDIFLWNRRFVPLVLLYLPVVYDQYSMQALLLTQVLFRDSLRHIQWLLFSFIIVFHGINYRVLIVIFAMLSMEHRASQVLCKCSTTEPHPFPSCFYCLIGLLWICHQFIFQYSDRIIKFFPILSDTLGNGLIFSLNNSELSCPYFWCRQLCPQV